MNSIAIVYATKTKHSKKLAEAIGQALNVKAENIADLPMVKSADLLFIVGGVYGGESLPELVSYVQTLDNQNVKAAALITSCASGTQKQATVRRILEEKNIPVAGETVVPGAILVVKMGHPNQSDMGNAVAFAKELVKRGA
jgi:flavodoxin